MAPAVPLAEGVVSVRVPTAVEEADGVLTGSAPDVSVGSERVEDGVEVGRAGRVAVLVLGGGRTLKETVAPHSSRDCPFSQHPALVQ